MKILLVNDDGYEAYGITLLNRLLSKYGEVYQVAPLYHQSGKSCALLIGQEMEVKQINSRSIALDGTPANCTSFGLNALNIEFDIVVSGCNHGLNTSIDTMYSGTIGACYEALINKIPAIAFSCNNNFEVVENNFDLLWNYIIENKLINNEYLLNINFPTDNHVKGINICKPHFSLAKYTYSFNENKTSFIRKDAYKNPTIDSDAYAVQNGFIAIVPLSYSSFSKKGFNQIKKLIRNKEDK